ncbi:hypothetical protein L3X38_013341 [Prunus dulcis]|uniref:Uncharacterized protein n=1 Tax=Prunus dulcis TaxID=3755 RepID=A0AAD4WLB8_PRUDU|nr:hypothetical protein L3X38_013341 [Prunus dulcis]
MFPKGPHDPSIFRGNRPQQRPIYLLAKRKRTKWSLFLLQPLSSSPVSKLSGTSPNLVTLMPIRYFCILERFEAGFAGLVFFKCSAIRGSLVEKTK